MVHGDVSTIKLFSAHLFIEIKDKNLVIYWTIWLNIG